jgi:hypothetical protein
VRSFYLYFEVFTNILKKLKGNESFIILFFVRAVLKKNWCY